MQEEYEETEQKNRSSTFEVDDFRPFTHPLSYVLLAFVVAYLILNIGYTYSCSVLDAPEGRLGFCHIVSSKNFAATAVPAIRRPVEFLLERGDFERARLVSSVYVFAWFSGVIACFAMVATSIAFVLLIGAEGRRQSKMFFEMRKRQRAKRPEEERDKAKAGLGFILVIAGYLFVNVFLGDV